MRFPSFFLCKKNRPTLSENRILDSHMMYARHKPGYDWIEATGLPDFSQIKLADQSFNWCIFSIPIWTRFNDKKAYLEDYAVVGFSVDSIRFTRKYDENVNDNTLGVNHAPLEFNYSHCQLKSNSNLENLSKLQRRQIRMAMKNDSIIALKPEQGQNVFQLLTDIIIMYVKRILSKLVFFSWI